MKKNSEVRIQESESRRSLRDATRTRTRLPPALSATRTKFILLAVAGRLAHSDS
ncbi:hypothetical protein HUN01_19310 [Nostoc edaphicum CCNP1411]|uniref:Uncharacterized protein n=1 Tax=Nostoc edaphicum CCNP1411 TaxID=1472755 RepID=A0A7D7QKF3_9NOSO|nr:hypothetical protein [Nostoc edaphicum]QMS89621.1 hypothetical protein HUN01_19310 [Nostoc edaphicum CCNP1411]